MVVKDACRDKWQILPNGAFQHSSGLCLALKNANTNDGNLIVFYKDCTNLNKQFTFSPSKLKNKTINS